MSEYKKEKNELHLNIIWSGVFECEKADKNIWYREGVLSNWIKVCISDKNYETAKNLFYDALYGSGWGRRVSFKMVIFIILAFWVSCLLLYVLYIRFSASSDVEVPQVLETPEINENIKINVVEENTWSWSEMQMQENHIIEIERLKMNFEFEKQSLKNTIELKENQNLILNERIVKTREDLNACINSQSPEPIYIELTLEEKKFIEVWKKIADICKTSKSPECLELFF